MTLIEERWLDRDQKSVEAKEQGAIEREVQSFGIVQSRQVQKLRKFVVFFWGRALLRDDHGVGDLWDLGFPDLAQYNWPRV